MDTLRILTCGVSKRLITLLVLLPLPAWAQGVPTFTAQTNIGISNNSAEIDAGSTFVGPGINLNGFGQCYL